jgi:ATP-dependent helicase/nuclease subunit B
MSVQFILGRSGSGKTRYCIDSITKALLGSPSARPLVLLVPEQATYQAERAILGHPQIAGFYSPRAFGGEGQEILQGLNILSFERLQYLLLGRNTAKSRLSSIGRQMIIHRILIENRDKLELFARSSVSPGLSRKIAEAVIELGQYSECPQDIEQLVARLRQNRDTMLSAIKISDLAVVLQEYLRFIETGFVDPDTQLNQVREAAGRCGFLKGAELWVDGFAGFTASETAILAEMLKGASQAHIALCLDAEKINLKNPEKNDADCASLFYPTERTYAELLDVIRDYKLELAGPVILKGALRFSQSRGLGHLEENIFEENYSRIKASDGIQIALLPNARSEVRFVARQICELVRRKGLRYRDIAVVASDLGSYEHYIRAGFEDYNLPFFIDRRQSVRHHPAVCIVISALRFAAGGAATSDIIACLKTGLLQVSDYEIDELENYCIAFAVGQNEWMEADDWDFDDDDLPCYDQKQVNRIRRKVVEPLIRLRNALCDSDGALRKMTADEFTKIVFDFLDFCRLGEQLNILAESAEGRNDYAAADEHRQVYQSIVDTFDELCEAFAGMELRVDELFSIIQDGFSRVSLALIPPALDQVVVGSIERSRHPDLKAVFLIGTTQKQFPSPVNYERILTDSDRMAAQAAGFELAPATERTLAERRYLCYIAFTRPSQFLVITYPAVDEKGRAVGRSQFVETIESLFEDVKEQRPAFDECDVIRGMSGSGRGQETGGVFTVDELCDQLCLCAAKEKSFENLLGVLSGDEQLSEIAGFVHSAVNYGNDAKLGKGTAAKLFAPAFSASATSLETFAACPYKYFVQYVLRLKERKEFKIKPIDLGEFYHSCLDNLMTNLKKEKIDFAAVNSDTLKAMLAKSVGEIMDGSSFLKGFCRRSGHNVAIITSACQNLEEFVVAASRIASAGVFRPAFTELSFGRAGDLAGGFTKKLKSGQTLLLKGKIDRIDFAEVSGKKLAVIFDYKKRRERSFGWQEFYSGLDIQLPLYMLAIRNLKEKQFRDVEVAGAFYLPVEAAAKPGKLSEPEGEEKKFNYKAKGIFNGDYYSNIDNTFESGWSRFYGFFISAKDKQYGNYNSSSVLRPGDFEGLLRLAEGKIIELSEKILSGDIGIRPYRMNKGSACRFCKFKPLCRFDWQINGYNDLPAASRQDVLAKAGLNNG